MLDRSDVHPSDYVCLRDLTGVEHSWTCEITLHSAGNKSDLFSFAHQPKKNLLDRMFAVVNGHWTKMRQDPGATSAEHSGVGEKKCPDYCAEMVKLIRTWFSREEL